LPSTNLRQKYKENIFFSLKFILPALVVLAGVFYFQQTALAACTTNSGVGGSDTVCDGLNMSISPATAKVGDSVTITYSVTDPELLERYAQEQKTLYVGVCPTQAGLPGCAKVTASNLVSRNIGTAFSGSFAYTVGGHLLVSKKTTFSIGGYIGMTQVVGETVNSQSILSPLVELEVTPASNSSPEIQITPKDSFVNKGVNKVYTVTYLNAGTSISVNSYTFICDAKGSGELSKPQNLSGTATQLTCIYPLNKQSYELTVIAALSDGTTISAKPILVEITGNEQKEGEGKSSPTSLVGFLGQVVNFAVGLLQEFVYVVFFYLVAPIIQAMLSIHPYTDTFVAVIYPGWEIVRNICNILFILALIIIGLATLFRVESYQYKHLLVQLIIAALTINFSLVIGQIILGFADTIQAQFLPANVEVIRSLAGELMVKNWRSSFLDATSFGSYSSSFSSIVTPLFYLALSWGAFIVFCAIAAFLMIRIIALWILLLISPVAFACGVLPSMASYRAKWWQEFLKYAFFTPIMAFFLNLTAVISNTTRDNPILKSISDGNLDRDLGGSGFGYFVIKVTSNLLLLIFLIAALKVAEQASVYGAGGITALAQKGFGAPFAGAGWLAKAGGSKLKQKYDEKTLGLASGGAFKRAAYAALHLPSTFKAAQQDSEKEREKLGHLREAAALKVKRGIPGFRREGRDPMYHAMLEQGEERLNEVYGHYTGNETEEVRRLDELEKRALGGDKKAGMMLLAQALRAAPNKHLNQFMDNKGLDYNQPNIIGMLDDWQEKGVISSSINEEFQTALSEQGYKIADFTLTELSDGKNPIHVQKNTATGQFEVVGEQDWKNYNEWVRNYAEANTLSQQQYSDLQKGMLSDPAFATQKAAFVGANPGFDEGNYINADRRQNQILKRDVNASKLERKSATFHNSLGTTNAALGLNAKGNRKQVLGESGNYTLTHLNNTDIWAAGRGQWTDKQKERMVAILDDHGITAADKLAAVTDMFKDEYKQELARNGEFKTDAVITADVRKKVANFVSVVYASKAAAGPDKIADKYLANKVYRTGPNVGQIVIPKNHVDELDTMLEDTDLEDMIDKATK